MRPRVGCVSCRKRHRKCFVRPGANKCNACDEGSRECRFLPRFRFKDVASIRQTQALTRGSLATIRNDTLHASDPTSSSSSRVRRQRTAVRIAAPAASDRPSQLSPPQPQREAELLKIYTQHLGPLLDACDESRQFTLAIPRLALKQPIIMQSILAAASKYDMLHSRLPAFESTFYHSRCIELIIEALSRDPGTYDSSILAAVVISRTYEEMDDDQRHFHLGGTRNLLGQEAIARSIREGGLAEAACWIHIRQSIYVSLVKGRPVDVPLDIYETFPILHGCTDSGVANRVVLLFAKTLQAFLNSSEAQAWGRLEDELASWEQSKPDSFSPLHRDGPDAAAGRLFPQIYMLSTASVIAAQHHIGVEILYELRRLKLSGGAGYAAASSRAATERGIAQGLGSMMGLAVTNEDALNAFYLPSHMLAFCGYCLKAPAERQRAIVFLDRAQELIHWNIGPVKEILTSQWHELDGC